MGFGLLFIGYLFLGMNSAFTAIFGVGILFFGMRRLRRFNLPLSHAGIVTYPLLFLQAGRFVLEMLRFLPSIKEAPLTLISDVLDPLSVAMLLFFLERLFSGIEALAIEIDLPKVRFRAKRQRLFSLLIYALWLVLEIPIPGENYEVVRASAYLPVALALLVTVILNAVLIWSCYMWICMPEDLDMKRKPTGIRWLDRIEDKLEADEEKRQAEKKEELEKLFRSRQEKYRQKQKRKKK